MSEKLHPIDHQPIPSQGEHDHQQKEKLQKLMEAAEKAKNEHHERLPELQHEVKEQAISGKEYTPAESSANKHPHAGARITRELKQMAFQRTITRVRKHLSAPDKLLSKAIHQPVVDQVSRIGESTIARPSGLLGGSICAFAGSSALLWAAKHFGFAYNYLFFFLLFVAGFIIGLLGEIALKSLKRR